MPSTLFLSHSSTLSKSHYFPAKPERPSRAYTQVSSSLNPSKPTNHASFNNPNPKSLTSTREKPRSKNPPLDPIKTPAPPWIRAPLVLQPHEVADLSKPRDGERVAADGETRRPGGELSEKLVGRRGKNVVKKIARRIEKLGSYGSSGEARKGSEGMAGIAGSLESLERLGEARRGSEGIAGSLGSLERLASARRGSKGMAGSLDSLERLGSARRGSEGMACNAGSLVSLERLGEARRGSEGITGNAGSLDSVERLGEAQRGSEGIAGIAGSLGSLERLGSAGGSRAAERMPWERDEGFVFRRVKKERAPSAAELRLEKGLLERLRGEAGKMRKWVKVKKAGVTENVVDEVKSLWRRNELVMVRFDVPLCRNMDRAQEILELKTGGLVVWRRKETLVIYRGCDYRPPLQTFSKIYRGFVRGQETSLSNLVSIDLERGNKVSESDSNENSIDGKMSYVNAEVEPIPSASIFVNNVNFRPNSSLYEREADRLLDGLGPRFIDWWFNKPLPVDADLLPETVPGFRPPFRRCPPNTRSQLSDYDLTYLRKLARPLPTHFVLGRNRNLQGLAAAILKLWEKCHIAKIAVKLGVQNMDNRQMADELKCLTGGVLLLRNKDIIILYRGKDFLPGQILELISKREMELEDFHIDEENARLEVVEKIFTADEPQAGVGSAGSLSEFHDIQTQYVNPNKEKTEVKLRFEAERERLNRELRDQERKLSILNNKIERSTKELSKLNAEWKPAERDADREMLTAEERECFRKLAQKMRSVLVLGRRGIFDGVIEGLHQHWKHREVAKVVTMQRVYWRVMYTAKMLEAESGGVLVSVEKLKEGHGIIIYRGKNYRRPLKLKSENLLTKREALLRSLEMQRHGSLKFFAYQRQRAIADLKRKLENLQRDLES